MTEFTGKEVFEILLEFRHERDYDSMLHDSLSNIFRKRCFTSDQIKELLHLDESVIKPILVHQQPQLDALFSNKLFEGLSLLWIAVLCSFEKSPELLVRSGADVKQLLGSHHFHMFDKQSTILHALLQMRLSNPAGNERLIRLVADHGADLQARDSFGRNVLHFAVSQDRVDLAKWYLEKGVEVNVVDKNGMTPLLHAAKSFKAEELLPPLMEHGADVTAKDNTGRNALHSLAFFSLGKHTELARALIEKDASLHVRTDSEGYQPVHYATVNKNNALVELFLNHGADVNAQTITVALQWSIHGRTALHFACLYFNNENIKLLLSAGASILAEDSRGNTPFALIEPQHHRHNSGTKCMLRALALIKICQPSIQLKDEKLIEKHPELWDYYQNCITYVSRMKITKFVENCTFLDILVKSHNRVAELMSNPSFETNFGLYDLNEFDMYDHDIIRVFKRAQKHYRYMLEQQETIDEATFHMLPYLVLRKVVSYGKFSCCESVRG